MTTKGYCTPFVAYVVTLTVVSSDTRLMDAPRCGTGWLAETGVTIFGAPSGGEERSRNYIIS